MSSILFQVCGFFRVYNAQKLSLPFSVDIMQTHTFSGLTMQSICPKWRKYPIFHSISLIPFHSYAAIHTLANCSAVVQLAYQQPQPVTNLTALHVEVHFATAEPVRAGAVPTTVATRERREMPVPRSAARGVPFLSWPCHLTLISSC